MEGSLEIVPVTSLVPIGHLEPVDTLARKYWHIICKAQFILPCGLQVLKVSLFLVSFDNRLFLNIALEVIPTLPTSQQDIKFAQSALLPASEQCLMLLHGAIPLACGSFELPSCARCFLGYSCNSHNQCDQN